MVMAESNSSLAPKEENIDETTEEKTDKTKDEETISNSEETLVLQKKSEDSEQNVSKKEKETKESSSITSGYFWGGIEMAPALSTSDLGAGFIPQLELGVQFSYLNHMFGLVFHGSYHQAKASGEGKIPEMPTSSFIYDMKQKEGELGVSLRTVFHQVPKVQPEIWLGPTVQLLQGTVEGKIDNTKFPISTEQNTRIGFQVAILGNYFLPVGQVYGGCNYTTYMWRNTIQGETRSHLISPTIGYRYQFPTLQPSSVDPSKND